MTYDHQPFVSRLVWKSFGALARTNQDGLDRNCLINAALETWLLGKHPEIVAHYANMEKAEKEFLDGLKGTKV